MASLTLLLLRRQQQQFVSRFARRLVHPTPTPLPPPAASRLQVRGLHGSSRRRVGDKAAWSRSPEQQQQQQYQLMTELDKADALERPPGYRIGVIAYVQSDVGPFFILGGMCVAFGGTTYVLSLFTLRRMMLLSLPAVLLQGGVVGSAALFWLCAVSLYIGRLEVEIIHDDDEMEEEDGDEGCRECRERRQDRGYRGPHDNRRHGGGEDGHNKGQDK
ncbi:hypothetical protein CRUP_026066 [Coryphaenoides rupestris]|nr:hypothetical protein CRUP_026066 [Coryphaenoides rupestris]